MTHSEVFDLIDSLDDMFRSFMDQLGMLHIGGKRFLKAFKTVTSLQRVERGQAIPDRHWYHSPYVVFDVRKRVCLFARETKHRFLKAAHRHKLLCSVIFDL